MKQISLNYSWLFLIMLLFSCTPDSVQKIENGVIVSEGQEHGPGVPAVNGHGNLVYAEYTIIVAGPFDCTIDLVGFIKQVYGGNDAGFTVGMYLVCWYVAAMYGEQQIRLLHGCCRVWYLCCVDYLD